jgi:hypothetical protein
MAGLSAFVAQAGSKAASLEKDHEALEKARQQLQQELAQAKQEAAALQEEAKTLRPLRTYASHIQGEENQCLAACSCVWSGTGEFSHLVDLTLRRLLSSILHIANQ